MALSKQRLLVLCQARDRLSEPRPVDEIAVSVAAMADEAGISTGLFIREFARLFGETPHQRRIRMRLERAKQLLARGESVTDVCFEVGCASLGTFSALFSQKVGMTPSEYSAQARRLVQVDGLRRALSPGCFELMGAAFRLQFSRSAPGLLVAGSRA